MNKTRVCINKNLTQELSNFENLCEIFSFFTKFDSCISRSVRKWWNGILDKDAIILNHIRENNSTDHVYVKIWILFREEYIELLKWLKIINFKDVEFFISQSLIYDKFRFLKKLHDVFTLDEIFNDTIKSKYHATSDDLMRWKCADAARAGNSRSLKLLYKSGYSWNSKVCKVSLRYPRIQEYIHSLPFEKSPCGHSIVTLY